MRLTLRTLLAYMDDILDPADQEELGRKIEASAFATELIHRSRDAVRRLRLGAPDPLAGDSGEVLEGEGDSHLDANTAAEYLDNTLSPEAVAEFERSCLEAGVHADMLLAEAASCHHILTLVLGEPAEVDADLRNRMYALADRHDAEQQLRVEPAHASPSRQAAAAMTAAAAPVATRRPQVDPDEAAVPDYMLEAARTRRRKRRVAIAFVGAAIIGGVAAFLAWPQGEPQAPDEMAEMGDADSLTAGVEVGEDDEVAPDADDSTDIAATEPADAADAEAPAFDPSAAAPAADPDAAPDDASVADAQPATIPDESDADEAAAAAAASAAASTGAASTGAAPGVVDTTPAVPPSAETPAEPSAPTTAPDQAAAPTTPPQTPPQSPPGDAAAPVVTTNVTPQTPAVPAAAPGDDGNVVVPPQPAPPDAAAAAASADAATADPAAADPVPSPQPKQIGAYLGNNDVLLRHDASSEAWLRLPPRSALTPGDRLLALPTFRTHVVLADANAYLGGGTEIQLAAPAAGDGELASDIRLALPYGRFILNSGLNGNRIELTMGDEVRTLSLGPSSSLAVEVQRLLPPGADPQRDPLPLHVAWFLTSGTATSGDSLETNIEGPAAWITVEGQDQPPQAVEDLPKWIDSEPVTDTERRAREVVAESLASGDPVNVRLVELSDETNLGRLREVRSLAAKSGAYVGEFDPLVKALSDVNQRAYWKAHIDALRAALARDPAHMDAIHKALAVRGQDAADDLLEMLLGFSSEDVGTTREEVKNGALVRLIRWMEHDDLTYRVLASYNIDEITGTKNLGGYRPEHSASQRTREIKYYWDRLEKGELMPKEANGRQ